MNLLIDSGNSFIKWRLSEGDRLLSENRCETKSVVDLQNAWENLQAPSRVIVANVAGKAVDSEIRKLAYLLWQLEPEFVQSSRQCCGLSNSYTQPEQLGVDRWVAMVAAFQSTKLPVIVIDCGTAITIDLVNENGLFIGGVIMPGLYSSIHSLSANTDVVFVPGHSNTDVDPVAKSTEEGVTAGVMFAITGGIEKTIKAQTSGLDTPPVIYITGGDAEKILPHLAVQCIYQADLVLDGLSYYATSVETQGEKVD